MSKTSLIVAKDGISYAIESKIFGSYLGRGSSGGVSLLVPVTDARPPIDRATGDVVLSFQADVHFEFDRNSFVANAAIIECVDKTLEDTFAVLASDVAQVSASPNDRATPQEVSRALARWEELLHARRQLSPEALVGLWGELWMILQMPDAERAIATWRGPDSELVDFVGGGIGIDCKASSSRLRHFVSQDQVMRPLGDVKVYLQSMWVDRDVVAGKSVPGLISEIESRLSDRREFEEKLLSTGYSRADASRYSLGFRILEPPLLFSDSSVPRVRLADYGVSDIRYVATLNEKDAIERSEALAILMRLSVPLAPRAH